MVADSRAPDALRVGLQLPYVGRFAPSPTGPLHKGSLVAALASWLDARAHGGQWLLRIEDVDEPRCSKAAADTILHQLDALGLHWDGELLWQSLRTRLYRAALDRLIAQDLAFACACTRRDLELQPLSLDGTRRYPGTCRDRIGIPPRAWRFRVPPGVVTFEDAICGVQSIDVAADVGDFVLWRADGFCAYQLAVVVDDAEQGVTDVVRGADLLGSTPRQILLQQALRLMRPRYAHVPLVLDAHGEKLSKQTLARPLEAANAVPDLAQALRFLNHAPPAEVIAAGRDALLAWAIGHWRLASCAGGPEAQDR
ncbi:tRNA glutamyl-Q(34) synthetase GluQRS [Methyloversatilis sp. XJ19-49]|uniref:tRNA glutamyl-Q(34) synthetase GluQRS n=1 Tax=Methyloversatilis sp. XJ19-49 TaxID=2963429 RepID=UPI00211CA1E7|nr:tRNA glutamyl-Q(34) synthetase GluQRS [Methyloversatilis sp. XJ19-49]MCQ9379994.1 tRNA glutamyl-Q(34) synthetase GluQRS [Methyloversatilis sp. XJ19-49]